MMPMNAQEIIQASGASIIRTECSDSRIFENISTDTRTIQKNSLFVALKGARFDGHDFLSQAEAKGASAFLIEKAEVNKIPADTQALCLAVPDTLKAYGDIASFYRMKFKIPVIAITGSAGKTTVKELTAEILSKKYKVLKNRGTENNRVGVPKTLLELSSEHEVAVIECGTSEPGEIERLSQITRPEIAVVTKIGLTHIEKLKSLEGVKREKLSLATYLRAGGTLLLNADDPMLQEVHLPHASIIRVGIPKDIRFEDAKTIFAHEGRVFKIALLGRHNVLNALLASKVAEQLGVPIGDILKTLEEFKPVAGRLCGQIVNGISFIDDSYNSSPTSFKAALEVLDSIRPASENGRKILVCGDMKELGQLEESEHRKLGALVSEMDVDVVIGAGELMRFFIDEAKSGKNSVSQFFHVKDNLEAQALLWQMAKPADIVMVKGSRSMKMEKVLECSTNYSIH